MTHLNLPNGPEDTAIRPSDPMCMASQLVPNQTVGSPMLRASAVVPPRDAMRWSRAVTSAGRPSRADEWC